YSLVFAACNPPELCVNNKCTCNPNTACKCPQPPNSLPQGQYCGGAPNMIGCNHTHVYECNPSGGVCEYGYRDSCAQCGALTCPNPQVAPSKPVVTSPKPVVTPPKPVVTTPKSAPIVAPQKTTPVKKPPTSITFNVPQACLDITNDILCLSNLGKDLNPVEFVTAAA
ncbi:31828_t:CDS:2, partial [Racocetra persica]